VENTLRRCGTRRRYNDRADVAAEPTEGLLMHRTSLVVVIAGMTVAGLLAPQAHADGPRFELTPFVGYRAGGDFEIEATESTAQQSVDLGEAASFGLDLGLYRDEAGFYELLYSQQTASLDSSNPLLRGVDVKVEYLQIGGTSLFPQDTQWYVPYLSLTVGGTRLSAEGGDYDSETKFSASLGGGVRLPFNDNVAATLGLRGYLTFVKSNTDFFCVSGSNGGTCLLKSSGSTFFQGEALLGLTVRF
jgi:opacity protein-like surface antigen